MTTEWAMKLNMAILTQIGPTTGNLALYLEAADHVVQDIVDGMQPEAAFTNAFVPTKKMHKIARLMDLALDVQNGQWVYTKEVSS